MRLSDQLSEAGESLHTQLPTIVVVAAIVLLAAVAFRVGVDWLSVGLLVVSFGFIVFAAHAGVVASRYFIPSITLSALVFARSAVRLGSAVVVVAGVLLIGGGLWQARSAHDWVLTWIDGEQAQERLVRDAAGRAAGGCPIAVVGLNVEFVQALPVLMPVAQEPPHGCAHGERFVALLDKGAPGTETRTDNPVLAACRPDPAPVFDESVGKILRCTA